MCNKYLSVRFSKLNRMLGKFNALHTFRYIKFPESVSIVYIESKIEIQNVYP